MTRAAKKPKLCLSKSRKKFRSPQKPVYLTIRESGQLEHSSLDSRGNPLSFLKVHTHTYTDTHAQMRVRWLFSTAYQLYLFNSDQWVVLHRDPISTPVINMWVPLYQPQLQINQRVGHRRKEANISSITPERHHGEMQIASQETPGDVKEKLAGRQQEANEYNSKCIHGEGENPLYSYQLIQSYQWKCTVGGGPVSNPLPSSPLAPHKHLYYSTQAKLRSLALWEAGPGLGS